MRLNDLTTRRDEIQKELDGHRAALTAERLKTEPSTVEQRRIRDLIDECTRALTELDDDITFERERLTTDAAASRLTDARRQRDRALKRHGEEVSQRWLALAGLLKDAIREAGALSEASQQVAADASAAVWAHHDGPASMAARDQAGRAVTLALGDDRHAHALTCLLRDLVSALPASLPPRLAQRYLEFNQATLSGVPMTTMEAATAGAHEQLRARLAPLLA